MIYFFCYLTCLQTGLHSGSWQNLSQAGQVKGERGEVWAVLYSLLHVWCHQGPWGSRSSAQHYRLVVAGVFYDLVCTKLIIFYFYLFIFFGGEGGGGVRLSCVEYLTSTCIAVPQRPNCTHSYNVTPLHSIYIYIYTHIPAESYCWQPPSHSFFNWYLDISSPDPGTPPYSPGSFDRVLLDAPCSALGQRPQATCHLKLQELLSYPPYQRMLIKQVGSLLCTCRFKVIIFCLLFTINILLLVRVYRV